MNGTDAGLFISAFCGGLVLMAIVEIIERHMFRGRK